MEANLLTLSLNLPAQSRRQTAYVVFLTLRSPVFLINSSLGHFSATSRSFNTPTRRFFSRSYEANLPSSFTRVISSPLGYSPRIPVSVCGTGTCRVSVRNMFLVSVAVTASPLSHGSHSRFGLSPFSPDFNAVCAWRSQLAASPVLAI